MRLQKMVVDKIKLAAKNSFGDVDIYFFGSRVDDTKRGGDIDIAIDSNMTRAEFRKSKVKFASSMIQNDFDFKIDIVSFNTKDKFLHNQLLKNSKLL